MPKVSIIIPNYNHAPFLEQRIKSVLNQTYQDFEVIYLDDASTDDSNLIFSTFANSQRIKGFFNEKNSGNTFKQWNRGVRLAKGEYIWLAESDDYAHEDFLAKLVNKLDENPSVGLAYCHSPFADEHCNIEDWALGERWKQDFINNGRNECSQYLIFRNTIPNASAVLIRRAAYEKAGYADEDMEFCGDWMMWVKILLNSDLGFIAEPLNYYRRHSGTVSSRFNKSLVFVEERYRVMLFIKQRLIIPEAVLGAACESAMYLWMDNQLSSSGMKNWKRVLKVYELANRVDPRLKSRLAKVLIIRLLQGIRLYSPVATLAKRMVSMLSFPSRNSRKTPIQ